MQRLNAPATKEKLDPWGRSEGEISGIWTALSMASRRGTLEKEWT